MKSYETINSDGFEAQTERYQKIDALNRESFLMVEGADLQVLQSLHSVGASREKLTKKYADKFDEETIARAKAIGRVNLAGNMSPLNGNGPKELTIEERTEEAKNHLYDFFAQNDIDPENVRILRPERDYETPLTVLNLDEATVAPDDAGLLRQDIAADMVYTHNPDIVLAARPADCPIVFVTAETPEGPITVLLHLASLGVAHDYIPQAKVALDELGVDWASVRVQITPGGQEETYLFEDFDTYNPHEKFPDKKGLYVNLEEKINEEGKKSYDYGIDLPGEVYEEIHEIWGIDTYQMFLDTTDTTSPTVGYSSNSRAFKGYEIDGDNTRDIVLARRVKR